MTITRLLIARHGNTFTSDQTPTRVGLKTDLALVPSGQLQAQKLAHYLTDHNLVPDLIFTSVLKRTIEMGTLIEDTLDTSIPSEQLSIFNEIDYGPDENKTEEDVIARIGAQAIAAWNDRTIVPEGWKVNPEAIVTDWKKFGKQCADEYKGKTILAITSNGMARFAPHLTESFEAFAATQDIKISTGALCILEKSDTDEFWTIKGWNIRA